MQPTLPSSESRDDLRLCRFEGCRTPARTKGLCYKHGGGKKLCNWKGCSTPRRGGGLCQKHLSEIQAYFAEHARKDHDQWRKGDVRRRDGKRKAKNDLDKVGENKLTKLGPLVQESKTTIQMADNAQLHRHQQMQHHMQPQAQTTQPSTGQSQSQQTGYLDTNFEML